MASTIAYRSYAKINLYLDVLRRRRDSYHNIETIFQTVGLSDELYFTEQRARIALECSNPALAVLDSNLVYRAAVLLQEHTGCKRGVRIQLKKHIPIAAGLAGGSGNAAATLVALSQLWDLDLPPPAIRQLALELGSDVPFCTIGGTVAATRRGEEMRPLPPLGETWFVLIHPDIGVSASRVYNSPLLQRSQEKPFAGMTRSFRRALRTLAAGDVAGVMFNRMEQPVFADYGQLAKAKQRLLDLGCAAAAMSGSGPTLFGLCQSRRQANRVAAAITEFKTSVASTVPTALDRI
jgi:4-diphosphocytidyl-2-C-methyl-D-erythritol kinase